MPKTATIPQTDYTTGGRDISNTAIPIYQENLNRVNDYLADPQSAMQDYLDKYYSNNTAQSDFLRNYNRAMSGTTANNYAATTGGYASLNQRNYDDLQRYQNDLASRLQDQGVTSAYNMASGDYQNMLNAFTPLQNAYNLGQAYSDIEQQNAVVEQQNNNWLGNILGGVGQVASAVPIPWVSALGSAMQVGGDLMTVQAPSTMSSSNQRIAGAYNQGAYVNPYSGIANQLTTNLKNMSNTYDINGNPMHPWLNNLYSGLYGSN